MSTATAKVKEEFEALIPPTLFFFVALHLVVIIRSLMLEGTGASLGTSVSIGIAALILGKAVLITDMLPIVNRFPGYPLAYNIAWKTALYTVVAAIIHYLERLVDFWKQAGGFVAGNRKMLAEMVWAHFWAVQILLVILILGYCTICEVIRAIGADEARRMFFGPMLPKRPAA